MVTKTDSVVFVTPYGAKRCCGIDCPDGLVRPEFQDECDVNNIMKKWENQALCTHVNQFQGNYADVSALGDYQENLNKVIAAEDAFMSLPASIRERFENDPGAFCDFVSNPDNRSEMVKLGLLPDVAPAGSPSGSEAVATPPEAA